jgi:Ca2+-binding EF-hand superfamily protein
MSKRKEEKESPRKSNPDITNKPEDTIELRDSDSHNNNDAFGEYQQRSSNTLHTDSNNGNLSGQDSSRNNSERSSVFSELNPKSRLNSITYNENSMYDGSGKRVSNFKTWAAKAAKQDLNLERPMNAKLEDTSTQQVWVNTQERQNNEKTSFDFQDKELHEMFDILTREKKTHINFGDLYFFMTLFEINCTEEEITEMIRLADSNKGSEVVFDQFRTMARTKLIETENMIQHQDLYKIESHVHENRAENYRTGDERVIEKQNHFDRQSQQQANMPHEHTNSKMTVAKPNMKNEDQVRINKIENLSKLFSIKNFNFDDLFTLFKNSKNVDIENVPVEFCFSTLNFEKSEKTFSALGPFISPFDDILNFQELLINWISFQKWSDINKVHMSFFVIDIHQSEAITFEQLHKMLSWIHLERPSEKRKKVLSHVFSNMKLNTSDPIEIQTLEQIIQSYQSSLLDPSKLRIETAHYKNNN